MDLLTNGVTNVTTDDEADATLLHRPNEQSILKLAIYEIPCLMRLIMNKAKGSSGCDNRKVIQMVP